MTSIPHATSVKTLAEIHSQPRLWERAIALGAAEGVVGIPSAGERVLVLGSGPPTTSGWRMPRSANPPGSGSPTSSSPARCRGCSGPTTGWSRSAGPGRPRNCSTRCAPSGPNSRTSRLRRSSASRAPRWPTSSPMSSTSPSPTRRAWCRPASPTTQLALLRTAMAKQTPGRRRNIGIRLESPGRSRGAPGARRSRARDGVAGHRNSPTRRPRHRLGSAYRRGGRP